MLNISSNTSKTHLQLEKYASFKHTMKYSFNKSLRRTFLSITFVFFALLFLPWTQNVTSRGNVTSLHPEQRPQSLHSVKIGRAHV